MLPFGTIQKIADEIDALPDGWTSYLNRSTGEVYTLSDDDVFLIEDDLDDDSLPKWQLDELPKIREVLEGDVWVQLPSAFEVHEWSIMNDFSLNIADEGLRDELLHSIHRKGAFRNFKETIGRRGIEERWFQFKSEALERIVTDWLDAHDIPYSQDESASTPE